MNNILCVIVTYNRLSDLKECIKALTLQSYKEFDILIVNNGSTDGTDGYLASLPNSYHIINQANIGGAGGFYTGMKYMMDNGYGYLWLMDDDGIPDKKQLEELWKNREESDYLNALVLDKDNNEDLAFPGKINTVASICTERLTARFVHPFNGTFFSRNLIEKIGLIKREMFIWGDEKEYTYRAIRKGFKPMTVTTAIHFHPKEKGVKKVALPFFSLKNDKILVKPRNLSKYYYRNLGYIDAKYHSNLKSTKWFVLHFIYFLRTFQFIELNKYIKSYFAGRNDNYN